MWLVQISTLTRLQDLRLKVREIDAEGVAALQTLKDLRSLDLEVCGPAPALPPHQFRLHLEQPQLCRTSTIHAKQARRDWWEGLLRAQDY